MPKKAVSYFFQKIFKYPKILIKSSLASKIDNTVKLKKSFNSESELKVFAKKVAHYPSDDNAASLAKTFSVSIEAMANRLIELRYVLP
jgi:hypothetical protein